MNLRPWIPASALLFLAALTTAGLMWTQEPLHVAAQEVATPTKHKAPGPEPLVDQAPLLTARGLAALAGTAEEKQLGHQAERLANHEVDLAFADALRRAASAQAQESPEIKALAEVKTKTQAVVEADQQIILRLNRQLATAGEAQKGPLQDQLEVAKAQLELDQDEFDSASEDLARAGGDPQAKIKRLKEAHETVNQVSSHSLTASEPSSAFHPGSLAGRFAEWSSLRAKSGRLEGARQDALSKMQTLTERNETISKKSQQEKEDREAAKYWASNLVKEAAAQGQGPGKDQAQQAVSYLQQFGDVQRRLSDMGRRILDQKGLAEVYGNWKTLVVTYEAKALHGMLNRILWILGLALATYMAGLLVDHLFHRVSEENKGAGTLRVVVKLVLQVACALVILFIIFGLPAQTTTVLGLAGAGLTVAMKDFIVAFFGWFMLMGRNGIRVGDWVEIRGVGGEVVEIGLLRTVVLETGSWNDAGHPTGRRVSFVNSFAIEGHFFNFSTSGKWMWDELRVLIPTGLDPYPVIDGLQKLVDQETAENARLAEEEWKGATSRYRVQSFSASPGLNVVPTASGVEVRARYITSAIERHETRHRLNQSLLELMHGPRGEVVESNPKVEA